MKVTKITLGKAYKNWSKGLCVYVTKATKQSVEVVPFIGGFIAWEQTREISIEEFNQTYEAL